eukprot:350384-Chlamydomonas_euryale.AAC.9
MQEVTKAGRSARTGIGTIELTAPGAEDRRGSLHPRQDGRAWATVGCTATQGHARVHHNKVEACVMRGLLPDPPVRTHAQTRKKAATSCA